MEIRVIEKHSHGEQVANYYSLQDFINRNNEYFNEQTGGGKFDNIRR